MSHSFGRFGPGGERTILVPNPGGRRPTNDSQTPFAPLPEQRHPPGGTDPYPPVPPPGGAGPGPSGYGSPGYGSLGYGAGPAHGPGSSGFGSGPAHGAGDWATPQPPQMASEPAAGRDVPGQALILKRDIAVAPNENPFLQAAGPLLLLFGRLRVQLSRASSANLMEQVAAAIEDFEKDARAAGAQPQQTATAKYIVCATADDVVQNIPTDDRHIYTQYSMLSRFFGERRGGVRFFEELDRAKVDPSGNYHLLELQHACLAMGFQGVHRTSAGGAAALQQIQRNLYELLRRTRPAVREISPCWQGQEIAQTATQAQVPLWATGSVVAVLLVGFYLLLRFLLSDTTETTAAALTSVHPQTPIGIQRRIYAPPPPPPPPPPASPTAKLRAALQDDIAAQRITVGETGNQIVLRLAAALFAPGDAVVKPEFKALLDRVAMLLQAQPGVIRIVGHTDSAPIKTIRFPSNFHLSLERAQAVAQVLRTPQAKDRIAVEGKGADQPIASNETPEGRARNRRVEVLIPRGG